MPGTHAVMQSAMTLLCTMVAGVQCTFSAALLSGVVWHILSEGASCQSTEHLQVLSNTGSVQAALVLTGLELRPLCPLAVVTSAWPQPGSIL